MAQLDTDIAAGAPERPRKAAPGGGALLVAAGVFLSRIAGLIRDRVFAHYFGSSAAADAFKAAFRIPNFLQNLFGEGTLSASFIPVYARLLAEEKKEEAGRVAGAIAAILALVVSLCVLLGILATPWLIAAIAPGFTGAKRELTILLVRILFPGAGVLVLSSWCLGILNSHRRFFLSYAAPIGWNAVMIAALLIWGPQREQFPLAATIAWASVAGSAAQFMLQLPMVLRLARPLRIRLDLAMTEVRTVVRNFFPVFFGRGVIQISSYIDELLASLLPTGAFAAFSYAQTLYLLPVSLFGMSVSAAELPAMSSAVGETHEIAAFLHRRLNGGLRRIAYFIIAAGMAFLALGDVVVAAIYQTGRFGRGDVIYVWGCLAGATVGLLAQTLGRLYSSTYYALRDTRTPLRFAMIRVLLTASLGYFCALHLPGMIGIAPRWGVAGLTISAGIAGWIEFLLLRRSLNRRIGRTGLPLSYTLRLWLAAALAAGAAWGVRLLLPPLHPVFTAVIVLGLYGLVYVGLTFLLRVADPQLLRGRRRRSA
ncbi:MAG TPA: murein biosynthesis integral membrane protein MurJ [bacterium]|nr:murein biosynthesis integral membrane protein MurJ [bacterium]HPR88268.1 murein biosynthesis integral membrane protein MurJ [bacterium]